MPCPWTLLTAIQVGHRGTIILQLLIKVITSLSRFNLSRYLCSPWFFFVYFCLGLHLCVFASLKYFSINLQFESLGSLFPNSSSKAEVVLPKLPWKFSTPLKSHAIYLLLFHFTTLTLLILATLGKTPPK